MKYSEYLCPTYTRPDILFVRGSGLRLYDSDGKSYLDFTSGLACNPLGYSHPVLISEIKEQLDFLIQTSNLYYTEAQLLLAKELSDISLKGRVFFCNSGAEANEAAFKLARVYGKGRYKILTAKGSFHGRTLATLSATGQEKIHKGFFPLVSGFNYIEFNSLEDAEKKIDKETIAIMVEPIQGERGIYPATEEYLKGLRKLCFKNDLLLIFDEVQTGIGRTGYIFAYQMYNVIPDIITLAKGLAGGFPIGAMVCKKGLGELLQAGMHASTFGGNPISTRAGLVVLSIIDDNFLKDVKEKAKYFKERLSEIPNKEIRQAGLMIGMDIECDAKKVVSQCLEKGLLINAPSNNCIRFLPPLTITKDEIDEGISILKDVIANFAF
ncbi:MAG: aspartate aminotransferase family protein [bacterium]